MEIDLSTLGDAGGLVGLLGVIGFVLWNAWKLVSPKIQQDVSRLEEAQGIAHTDLITRVDRIRESEREAWMRVEELEARLDTERALRRSAEDEAAEEKVRAKTWELRHRRAVDELVSIGRQDLAEAIDKIEAGRTLAEPIIKD